MNSTRSNGRKVCCVRVFAALVLACAIVTPSHADNDENDADSLYYDPLESMNRGIFVFNRALDEMFFKPAARLYINIVPEGGRVAVTNVINNLKTPVTLANNVLQGEKDRAQATIARFMVNTVLGFGGIADVATDLGVPRHSEDFGQTAATYGVGGGPYLMLPFFGPSNVRDALGKFVDRFLDPLEYALENEASFARSGVEGVDQRARFLDVSEAMEKTSIDYYASIRSVFSQNRQFEIRNGVPEPITDIYGDKPAK